MTIRMTYGPRRLAIPAASIAAMVLAGCSSGNIGESWQCPLADTGSCDSVAAADPAVPDIWIAPFVDGNGVYREASHVRVVLEPAGWRLPR